MQRMSFMPPTTTKQSLTEIKENGSIKLSLNTDPTCCQCLKFRPYGTIEIQLLSPPSQRW